MLAAGIFFSCESETNTFDFDLENNTSVELIDLVLPSRSIFVDSLRTDNEFTVVAGKYSDARFGTIEAEAFTEISYSEGRIISDSLQYDSLIIKLTIENFVSNDPSLEGSFGIYGVREDLERSVVYLKDRDGITGILRDSMRFTLRDQFDSLKQNIKVNANFLGQYLYSELIDDDVNIEADGFITDLAFVSTDVNQSAITINLDSDSTEILLYTSFDTVSYETRFVFSDLVHYSSIINDYQGTELEGLEDRSLFDLNDETQVISPIFGVYNYLDLSPLQDFIVEYGKVLINRAEIRSSLMGSNKEEIPNLRYYFHDQNYGFKGEGIFTNGYFTAVLANQAYIDGATQLLIASLDKDESVYTQDITFFIENYYNYYVRQNDFLADGIVLTPNRFVTLQESELQHPSSTTVKIYVTSIN